MSEDSDGLGGNLTVVGVLVFVGAYWLDAGMLIAAVAGIVAAAVWFYSPLPNGTASDGEGG